MKRKNINRNSKLFIFEYIFAPCPLPRIPDSYQRVGDLCATSAEKTGCINKKPKFKNNLQMLFFATRHIYSPPPFCRLSPFRPTSPLFHYLYTGDVCAQRGKDRGIAAEGEIGQSAIANQLSGEGLCVRARKRMQK